ncbi:glycosyltransferase family 2 protein [Epibacterium sp. DP7N7-1]|nr:glycosyltransferase family 2 protein [Epibacterium sp. DP7N7-1]
MTTWSVVAILKEPWPVLERFISWHLTAGVERLHLVFDDPEDPSIARLKGIPEVDIHPATDEFWQACGANPEGHFTHRQNKSMHYLYKQATSDWVVNLDGDELVYCRDGLFADLLALQPTDVRSVLMGVAEHVGRSEDGARCQFRLPMWPRLSRRVYRDFSCYMEGNSGLVGHTVGKSAVRTGLPSMRFHPHWLVGEDGKRIVDRGISFEDGVGILHYYADDYDVWRRKLDYRVNAQARNRRTEILTALQGLLEAGDEEGIRDFYKRMHQLNARQVNLLVSRERLLEVKATYPSLADVCNLNSG